MRPVSLQRGTTPCLGKQCLFQSGHDVLVTNRRFAVGQRSIPSQQKISLSSSVEEHGTRAWFPAAASTGLSGRCLAGSAAIDHQQLSWTRHHGGRLASCVAVMPVSSMDQPRYSIAARYRRRPSSCRSSPATASLVVEGVNKSVESAAGPLRRQQAQTSYRLGPAPQPSGKAEPMWSRPLGPEAPQLTVAQTRPGCRDAHVHADDAPHPLRRKTGPGTSPGPARRRQSFLAHPTRERPLLGALRRLRYAAEDATALSPAAICAATRTLQTPARIFSPSL